jgi:hypothetical protein
MATHYYLIVRYYPSLPATHGKVEDAFTYDPQTGAELPSEAVRVSYEEYLSHPVGSLWKSRVAPRWRPDEPSAPTSPSPVPGSPLPLARNGVKSFSTTVDGGLVIQLQDGSLLGVTLENQLLTSAFLEADGTLRLYSGENLVVATGNTYGVGGFEAGDGQLTITRVDTSTLTVDPTGAKITTVKDIAVPAGATVVVDTSTGRTTKWVVLVEDRTVSSRLSFEVLATNQFNNSVEYTVYARTGNAGAQVITSVVLSGSSVQLSVTNNELNTQFVSFIRSSL